jgi:hypothetical protein
MKLMVAKTQFAAKMLRTELGDDWMTIGAGEALMGHHFTAIVLLPGWSDGMDVLKAHDWKMTVIMNRRVNTDTPVYDLVNC